MCWPSLTGTQQPATPSRRGLPRSHRVQHSALCSHARRGRWHGHNELYTLAIADLVPTNARQPRPSRARSAARRAAALGRWRVRLKRPQRPQMSRTGRLRTASPAPTAARSTGTPDRRPPFTSSWPQPAQTKHGLRRGSTWSVHVELEPGRLKSQQAITREKHPSLFTA